MQQIPTTFGLGTPTMYPTTPNPWTLSSFGQGIGAQQFSQQPFLGQFGGGSGLGTGQPLQQIVQLLQIVPQQLQQLQYLQQQQLSYIQQLLQLAPAQLQHLQQLQQLIQYVPHQVHQLQQQQWQPFSGTSSAFGFGLNPQAFGQQAAGHVM